MAVHSCDRVIVYDFAVIFNKCVVFRVVVTWVICLIFTTIFFIVFMENDLLIVISEGQPFVFVVRECVKSADDMGWHCKHGPTGMGGCFTYINVHEDVIDLGITNGAYCNLSKSTLLGDGIVTVFVCLNVASKRLRGSAFSR